MMTIDGAIDGAIDGVIDVAVIGAGLAGLVCAQQLKQFGYRVVVLEKSRGVGGRLATRRLQGTCADHGVRSLNRQGALTACLIQALLQQDRLQLWTDTLHSAENLPTPALQPCPLSQPYYANPTGLTAVAKFLAAGLEIRYEQRVQMMRLMAHSGWQLSLTTPGDASPLLLTAQAVVVAVPAPQALALLDPQVEQSQSEQKPLAPELDELVQAIRRVEFDPCISVIATYPAEQPELAQQPWRAITFPPASGLAWLSLESTKRPNPQPLVVGQSTAAFARQYLDLGVEDLKPIGQFLLNQAAAWVPWLSAPTELQVHRWRYALVSQPLKALYLATSQPHPLVCCGDWCGGQQVENALESGLAAACQISHRLNHHPLSTSSWQTHALELMHQLTTALVTTALA